MNAVALAQRWTRPALLTRKTVAGGIGARDSHASIDALWRVQTVDRRSGGSASSSMPDASVSGYASRPPRTSGSTRFSVILQSSPAIECARALRPLVSNVLNAKFEP